MKLEQEPNNKMLGFADNSPYKQGKMACGYSIKSMRELKELHKNENINVVIASRAGAEIASELTKNRITILGICCENRVIEYAPMTFEKLNFNSSIKLYAGDICDEIHMDDPYLYGLSINRSDKKHIYHDITSNYPLPDECIDSYQAEDVLEHIPQEKIVSVINEIYRILKQGALFRICLPDYFSPRLKRVSMKDSVGNVLYDAWGGGTYGEDGVGGGGHLWFPNYVTMSQILKQTKFGNVDFLCYHTEAEKLYMKDIDFSLGYIDRINSDMDVHSIYSMVIDCYK